MLDGDDFRLDDIPVPSRPEDGPSGIGNVVPAPSGFDDFDLGKKDPDPTPADSEDSFKRTGAGASSKSSVLGTELAKKRLQAFCIQKKLSTLPVKPAIGRPSNVFVAPDSRPETTVADKTKNATAKKSKKTLNGYEKRCNTLSEIMEQHREEKKKLALVKLGIPLSLVPGGTNVNTLPMPTKAMPPIKNFLDPREVEMLLAKAMTEDFDLDSEPLLKFDKKSGGKQDSGSSRQKKHHRDRYKRRDSRDDRSKYRSRDRDRRDRDSRSDRDRKRSSDSSRRRDEAGKKREDRKPDPSGPPARHEEIVDDAKKPIRNVFSLDDSSVPSVPNKDDFQIDSVQQIKDDTGFDILSIEEVIKCETAEEEERLKKLSSNDDPPSPNRVKYSKFLGEKFIPFPDSNELSKSSKESVSPRKTASCSDASENDNSRPMFDKKLTLPPVLYSPGLETSEESAVVLSPFSVKCANLTLNKTKKESREDKIEYFHIWNDIDRACYPNKHYSDKCYRKTTRTPPLSYCENINFCECKDARSKNHEKLSSNSSRIIASFLPVEQALRNDNAYRSWYPEVADSFKNSILPDILSNWETDDSLSQPCPPSTKRTNDSLKTSFDNISEEIKLNFKDLNISKKVVSPEFDLSYDMSSMSSSPCLPVTSSKLPVTSLASEYEKFMEAVSSKLDDEVDSDEAEKSPLTRVDNSTFAGEDITDNLIDSKLLNNNKSNLNLNSTLLDDEESASKPKSENIDMDQLSADVYKNDDSNKNETKEDACWSSDDLSGDQKNAFMKYHSPSSKSPEKRKGHAKISSRRKKGKHKESGKKKSHQSSSDSSNSDDSSSSSTEASKSSSSSDNSTTSNSSSSSSDSSSVSSSSSSDSSSSTSSSDSSSDEKSTKKKKKMFPKKEIRKLSKSKRKQKEILAKAKELAKKLRRKKRKKKLKKKLLAQEKDTNEADVSCEKIDDDTAKNNTDVVANPENASLTRPAKRKDEQTISNVKNKKRKRGSDESSNTDSTSSSSTSSSLSDSGESTGSEPKKRARENSDSSEEVPNAQSKRAKIVPDDEIDKNTINVDTLLNIKTENVSDEEESNKNAKSGENLNKANRFNFAHDIVNANELQNDFLHSKKDNDGAKIVVKTENVNEDKSAATPSERSTTPELNNDSRSYSPVIISTSSTAKGEIQVVTPLTPTAVVETAPIERIESVKPHRERKPSRWGVPPNPEYHSHINNSSLIEVPIRMSEEAEVPPDANQYYQPTADDNMYNIENSEIKTEPKIYKIQTISSRNVIPNIQNYDMNPDGYENFESFEKQDLDNQVFADEIETTYEPREPLRKISLDDRINMVLQGNKGDNITAIPAFYEKPPERGILVVGGSKLVDPRIVKTKRVRFADGYTPGQDSDCENESEAMIIRNTTSNSNVVKRKKRKSCGGHAYPCPPSWPDYHPRWDKLPPPAPPPGSPPPELCEKNTAVNMTSSVNPLSRIPRIPNVLSS